MEKDYKKLYEEALERAKVVNKGTEDYNIVTAIFPELKESEDEKLSKKLHECVCRAINNDKLPYEERKYISEQVIPYLENLEKQKEQKATWSEEDEKKSLEIKYLISDYKSSNNELCSWIDELKNRVQPQSQWKPTREQMEALANELYIIEYNLSNTVCNELYLPIKSLYNDLKEL